MTKDVRNSSSPAPEKAPGSAFTVPRPVDVPGSTPPPGRKSMAPDAPPKGQTSSVPPRPAGKSPDDPTSVIPRAGAVPRITAPPRPETRSGRPEAAAEEQAEAPPRPAVVPVAPPPAPVPQPAPFSGVVVTPMRIIEVSGPPSSKTRSAAQPSPAPSDLPGSDYPTPLEIPTARRSGPPPEEPDDEEEAVPLRRLSTPPPAPEETPRIEAIPPTPPAKQGPSTVAREPQEMSAQPAAMHTVGQPLAEQAGDALHPPPAAGKSDPHVAAPPLGAPPPPPPMRDALPQVAGADVVPQTRPSANPRPKPPLPSSPELATEVSIEEIAPESDPQLVSLDDMELTELNEEEKRRRLPPPPPLRTSFSDGAEDSKRKPWWEEFFQEDYELSTPDPTPRQIEREAHFIENMLGLPPNASILDVGCGSGHLSIALAKRGFTVTGLDVSTAMLMRSNSRARPLSLPVDFVHGDMREMSLDKKFDAVLCWNASFGYFEREKNQAVLRCVHDALKPGGSLLLDVPNRDFIIAQEPAQNWFEGEGCVCMDDMRLDYITSRLLVKRTIMLDDGRNRECHYSMRVFSLHEVGRLLHETGFRVTQLSGSISTPGVFFGSTSPRMIVLVTKP